MAVKLPSIHITFRQLADTFVTRSQRGVALLIVRDATPGGNGYARYTAPEQLAEAPYTETNKQYIRDALSYGPYQVGVAKIGAEDTVATALQLITAQERTGWITVCDGETQDWTDLTAWIKGQEAKGRSWKAVVYKATTPDSMQVVNLDTDTVVFADDRGSKTGAAFTPALCGLLASCSIFRSATGMVCRQLASASAAADPDAAVAAGKFILMLDDDQTVRVAVDVNSLTTLDETHTEDMQYIETVEAINLIRDDVTRAFHDNYRGQRRNSLNNQMLFVAAVTDYLHDLTLPDIAVLDDQYDNRAAIDVESQRAAWIAAGHPEARDWDDAKVRAMPFKRDVFLGGDLKILGSMTSLHWLITLV